MRWGGVIVAAFVVVLVRPGTWALGLAGFLARGGVVLLALPILALPTPSGLQNVLGGPLSTLIFGAPSPTLIAVMVGAGVGAVVLLIAGTLAGAWAERAGIALALRVGEEEDLVPPWRGPMGGDLLRIACLRLLGLVPLAIALLLAWPTIYAASYRELLLPFELQTPLIVRILRLVPEALLGVALAWVLGEAAASVAVRRMLLQRRAFLTSWLVGYIDLVRRPHRVLGTALLTTAVFVLLVGPALVAAAYAWNTVRALTADGADPLLVFVAILLFTGLWLGGLVLAGAVAAFRNAAWTFELPRRA
jgi:hypothetical protein